MTSKEISMPLSGDVLQTINPWTIWLKSWNQQLGFINITNVESGDYKIEKSIIEDVASYGRQLGWIIEALELVLTKIDLNEKDKSSIKQFYDLVKKIDEVKQDSKSAEISIRKVERMIDRINSLKNKEPKTYDKIVSQIKEAFSEE